jgi:hypothetical protein
VDFRLDPSLCREASVPACIHPDVSVIDQASDSFQVQIWEDYFNRPDVCQHGPDARSTDMEIVYSTSIVRMLASHGPDARLSDMEIAC